MSGKKINIFVNMGMGGRGTSTFQVYPTMKVSAFLQAVVDKEGVLGVRIICMGKQMEPTRNGKELTLQDYGVYNNINVHAALRLKGGAAAEGPSVRHFDCKEVEVLGGTVLNNPHNPNGPKGDCHIGCSDGCYESNVMKTQFPCGCVFCADCLKVHVNNLMVVNSAIRISCATTSHGKDIDIALAYAAAGLTEDERNEFNKKMNETQFTHPEGIMHICPVQKCQSFVFRDNKNSTRIECGVCHKFMCWDCRKEFKTNIDQHCGNANCDDMQIVNRIAQMQAAKNKTIAGLTVTDTRMCPKCKCVNIHAQDCQHMTCKKCRHEYCHICLKNWRDSSGKAIHGYSPCQVAPIQTAY